MSKFNKSKENVYYIEEIIDKKIEEEATLYLVKWEGFSESENTWEPLKNLKTAMKFVNKYEKGKKKQ